MGFRDRLRRLAAWMDRGSKVMDAGIAVLQGEGVTIPIEIRKVQEGLDSGRATLEVVQGSGALKKIDDAFDAAKDRDLHIRIGLYDDAGVLVEEVTLTDTERDTADFAFDAIEGVFD